VIFHGDVCLPEGIRYYSDNDGDTYWYYSDDIIVVLECLVVIPIRQPGTRNQCPLCHGYVWTMCGEIWGSKVKTVNQGGGLLANKNTQWTATLWLFNIAMENGSFIDDFSH